jgi:hypothetical protein
MHATTNARDKYTLICMYRLQSVAPQIDTVHCMQCVTGESITDKITSMQYVIGNLGQIPAQYECVYYMSSIIRQHM